MLEQSADLRVFNHHIYEFKKGIRGLILTTEKAKYKDTIENKLKKEKIDYVIHDIEKNKINVYFGEKPCVDVVYLFFLNLSLKSKYLAHCLILSYPNIIPNIKSCSGVSLLSFGLNVLTTSTQGFSPK